MATLLQDIRHALDAAADLHLGVERVMALLAQRLPDYRWVGVYWLRGEELVLGPYVGEATDHTRIPVGRGVCGTAVAENRDIVVADVRELSNYLACSTETRSEIVVLIRDRAGRILGQIDVDGHRVGAFGEADRLLLAEVADAIAHAVRRKPHVFADDGGGRSATGCAEKVAAVETFAPIANQGNPSLALSPKRISDYRSFRAAMNQRILGAGFKPFQRFFALDAGAYRPGALDEPTKELMGLAASLVLRCDDCVTYHLDRCVSLGFSAEELYEALNVGLIVGGSIVIPHLRRAVAALDELLVEDPAMRGHATSAPAVTTDD